MVTLWWVLAATGSALFLSSLALTLRANASTRVPYARNADVIPAGTVVARALGAALLVFGSVMVSVTAGAWAAAIPVAVALVALLAVAIHNRRVARQRP